MIKNITDITREVQQKIAMFADFDSYVERTLQSFPQFQELQRVCNDQVRRKQGISDVLRDDVKGK